MRTEDTNKSRGNERLRERDTSSENRALLRAIFDESLQLMGILKPDGTVVKINSTAYGYIKGKESEVIGRPFWDTPWWTYLPEQQERLHNAINAAAQGQFSRFETTHLTPEGKLFFLDFSLQPVTDEHGNVVLLVPEGRDITERKLAEEAQRENYSLLSVMFEQSSLLMGVLKPDGTLFKANPTAYEYVRGKESEAIDRPFWETPWWTYSPEQQERLRDAIKAAARGEFVRFETTHLTPEGKLFYLDFSLKPVMDEKGDVVLLLPEGRDITDRKLAEEAQRENYALLRVMFEQSSLLMGLLKPDGTLFKVNPTAYGYIKAEESEVIGKLFWETPWWTHCREQQERLKDAVKRAAMGEFIRFETTHVSPEGQPFYLDFSLKPVTDEKNNVVLLLPEGRDITERKLAEEALREAAVNYRIVADNTYNWEFWLSPEGRFIYTSPSCQRITGYEAKEFNADPGLLPSIIHPDDRQLWNDHRHDVMQTKALNEVELRIVRPDGDIRWLHHVCLPVFNDNGKHLGTRGSFTDITRRKQAEEKSLRLAVMVESSDDAIIGNTLDGIIVSWNKGAEKILGYTEDEVLGKPVRMLIPPGNVDEALQMHDRLRRGEHIEHFETVRRRKDGQLIHMSFTYSPVRDAQGKVVGLSTIGRDITERKEMEQMKDEMVSAVSHEMRTPLTAMMGYTEFMLDNEVTADEQRNYHQIILRETKRLNELISNFLDLQRFRYAKQAFACRPLPLQPLLEETVALFAGVSERHHISLDYPSDLPQIWGDDKQLRQVFNNLVSNAVKYSPKGGEVRVTARLEKDSVVVTVRDEGIGIPPHALEKIFEKFYRVDNTARREFGGTGLGLTLVREIITAHGGKVWVESTPGKGSKFIVSFPLGDRDA